MLSSRKLIHIEADLCHHLRAISSCSASSRETQVCEQMREHELMMIRDASLKRGPQFWNPLTKLASRAGVECDPAHHQERQDPEQHSGSQNHAAAWLCNQSEPPLADRKGFWVVGANWTAPASQVARTGEE